MNKRYCRSHLFSVGKYHHCMQMIQEHQSNKTALLDKVSALWLQGLDSSIPGRRRCRRTHRISCSFEQRPVAPVADKCLQDKSALLDTCHTNCWHCKDFADQRRQVEDKNNPVDMGTVKSSLHYNKNPGGTSNSHKHRPPDTKYWFRINRFPQGIE